MKAILAVLITIAFTSAAFSAPGSKLTEIQGIGDATKKKLVAAGVTTVEALLEKGATPAGRVDLAAKSGIGEAQILKFVNYADLFRVKGIAGQTAELLEAAGVNTVAELAQRNAANLAVKIKEVNDAKKLTGKIPSEKQLAAMIDAAKKLPKMVTY